MESGFRKLWSRKKSWGSVDQPSNPRKLSSSNGLYAPSQTAVPVTRDGRPSMSSSYQLERAFSRDTAGGSRDLSSMNGEELGRTKSGHRIQPMLVGISRPETARDRPDTAGSLQTAVQKAGDSVGRRPSEISAAQATPMRLKSPVRHVDIFSIAASAPSYLSRYNEEIAERNLDTYRLVLENTPYVYDPSSKYQEEVAIRNAYLPYKNRPSTDTLRRSMDHDRTASITSRSMRSLATPQPNGAHAYHNSVDSTGSGVRSPRDQAVQHSHQRSRDGNSLSSLAQEQSDEDGLSKEDKLKINTQFPYSPTRSLGANLATRENRMSTIAEGQPYEVRPSTATSSGTQRDSGYTSGNAVSDYKLSVAEQGGHPSINRPLSDQSFELKTNIDAALVRPPRSTASSIKQRIILPNNRTIMDLTNEDSEVYSYSETSSAFGYSSQYSPIVEQAKSDEFKRILPSQIHTEEHRSSRGPSETAESRQTMRAMYSEDDAMMEDATTPRAELQQKPFLDLGSSPGPAPLPDPEERQSLVSSSFSPISTVASWSPRSTMYIVNPPEPVSMTARVIAALEASKAISKENPLPIPSRNGNETPTVRERVASFENNAERSVSPSNPAAENHTNALQSKPTQSAQTTYLVEYPQPSETPAKPQARPTTDDTITPIAKTEAKVPFTPSIYTSPDSITSVDYVNPSSTFGIRTRDFALSPRKSNPSLKKTTKSPVLGKAQTSTSSAVVSSPSNLTPSKVVPKATPTRDRRKPRTPRTPAGQKAKDTGFDEEAFARKQAEARAALERLQRSLDEDFVTMPDPATIKSAKGKGKEVESEIRPSAPKLILPQESKTHVANIPTQRGEIEKPPPSSFRNARMEPAQRTSLVSNPRSLSAGSRSSRRAPAPSTLRHVEPATNPIDQNVLSPALLQALQVSSNPPKSPGEISLSSFPVPSSRPPSQPDAPVGYHSHNNSIVGAMKRRSSTKSQGSNASAFSIPLHMIPGRTSSVRDPVPEEVDAIYG